MAVVLLISIILIDQVSKIIVKTNMSLHECIDIFSWFKIVFIENNGMAYGMEIGRRSLPVTDLCACCTKSLLQA